MRGARDGIARAEHGGASSALFDDDAESDAYLGWQAHTRTRQELPFAIPVRQVSSREEQTLSMT